MDPSAMEGLDDFEKSLAAGKAEREKEERDREERRHRKHKHHHRHDSERDGERDKGKERDRHRHRRHRDDDDDSHRSKRSRHSRDDKDDERRSRHRDREEREHKTAEPKQDDEKPPSDDADDAAEASKPLVRDSWMTAPSSIEIDYVHRPDNAAKPPSPKPEPKRVLHHRELNRDIDAVLDKPADDDDTPSERTFDYTFGDAGSGWRMTKLRAVYSQAEDRDCSVDEAAIERFGNLQEFDDAREEKEELERRKLSA
ncbi:hypothetical protein G7Z17_g12485 [Cylindrodendrum hubeiense]|uniref:Uncharacterized protein n=1 Tax=Cylindrodendrum hubeiense TaxID=595255 RepID=A0A9P5H2Z3_9HYPO|nr:hypothetical protein G7Z17_g12485 [Cylindrodendrum hubeiense]